MTKEPENRKPATSSMNALIDNEEEEGGGASFLNLFASLMILLMTFFIVIYSFSTVSKAKFEMARQSLYKAFEKLGVVETKEIITFLKTMLPYTPDEGEEHKKITVSLKDISEQLQQEFGGCNVELQRYETTILVPETAFFEEKKAVLTNEGKETLDKMAAYIQKESYEQIVIGGYYISSRKGEGTPEIDRYDWILSTIRSVAVAQYLVGKALPAEKISAIGYGNGSPLLAEKTDDPTQVDDDNRMEIIIKKKLHPEAENIELRVS